MRSGLTVACLCLIVPARAVPTLRTRHTRSARESAQSASRKGVGDDDNVSAECIAVDMLGADSDARDAFVACATRPRDGNFAGSRTSHDAGALGQDRGIAKGRASRRSLGELCPPRTSFLAPDLRKLCSLCRMRVEKERKESLYASCTDCTTSPKPQKSTLAYQGKAKG